MTGKESPRREQESYGINSSNRKMKVYRRKMEKGHLMPLMTRKTVVKGYWKVSEELVTSQAMITKNTTLMKKTRQLLTLGKAK